MKQVYYLIGFVSCISSLHCTQGKVWQYKIQYWNTARARAHTHTYTHTHTHKPQPNHFLYRLLLMLLLYFVKHLKFQSCGLFYATRICVRNGSCYRSEPLAWKQVVMNDDDGCLLRPYSDHCKLQELFRSWCKYINGNPEV